MWRKGSLCRRLRLYRGTNVRRDFCIFTGKQFAGTTKSVAISSAISKIPSRSHILRILLTIPDGTCASRLRPGQSAQDHRRDFMTMRRHQAGKAHHMRSSHSPSMRLCGAGANRFSAGSLSTDCALSYPDRTPTSRKGIAMITIAEGQKTLARFALACQYCNAIFIATSTATEPESQEKRTPAVAASSPPVCGTANGWRMGDTAKHHMRHGINLRFIAALSCG